MESNQSLVCPELANQSLVCPVLAEPLVEEILTWLPVESLCRFRSVCQQWNALISSAKFITTQWAQAPPNRMPWLLVHNGKLGVAYCFYTGTWKKTSAISFSFVGDNHRVYSTAAGLLLLSDRGCFTVCNPLTRSFIELPPMTSIRKIKTRVIVAGEGDHPETYKVVAMGLDSMNRGVVEIYDSTKKSWGIAPHRLPDLILYYIIARCEFVFCSGFFYCVGHCRGNWKIMGFSMTDEISISKDLPRWELENYGFQHNLENKTYLAVCGSQLLVVVTTFQGGNLQQVIICEFEKVNVNSSSSSSQLKLELKETVRMPSSLCTSVNRFPTDQRWPAIRCLGVKDCVCLRFFPYDRALKMITYNIREKTWTELPSVYFEDGYFTNVFEPRPDMKVQ